jgi:membrane fusion protein (multidrug efflux system)
VTASDVFSDEARTPVRWRVWLLGGVLVIAIAALAMAASRYLAAHVTTDDAFVEIPTVYVSPQVTGRVVEIAVDEHQRVEQGDVLVRLDPAEYELALSRAEAAASVAGNRVIQAEAASAAADADRKAATVEVWRTSRELSRIKSLRREGTVSQSDLDTAQAAHEAAMARVQALELRVEAEHALVNDDSQVRLAEAERRRAALDLDRTVIRAPFSGVVGRRNVEVGAVVASGQPLLALVSTAEASVMANFKETQLEKIRIGAPADVTVDAFPGVVWHGRVDSFSPATGAEYALIAPEPAAGNFTKVVQRVPVKIVFPQQPAEGGLRKGGPLLASGLSAEVDVHVE